MTTPLSELQDLIRRYMRNEISLEAFQSEFVPIVWNAQLGDQVADLAFEVELRLAEYTNGDWTEPELRDLIEQAARASLADHAGRTT